MRDYSNCFLGRDAVGVVIERGSALHSGLQLGSRVAVASLPIQCSGFWAEFATAPALDCALLPDSIPTEMAAALPYAALTALQSLRNRVSQGSRVLVHGGQYFMCHTRRSTCDFVFKTLFNLSVRLHCRSWRRWPHCHPILRCCRCCSFGDVHVATENICDAAGCCRSLRFSRQ